MQQTTSRDAAPRFVKPGAPATAADGRSHIRLKMRSYFSIHELSPLLLCGAIIVFGVYFMRDFTPKEASILWYFVPGPVLATIPYELYRIRWATISHEQIVFKGLFRSKTFPLKDVIEAHVCTQYQWGGFFYMYNKLFTLRRYERLLPEPGTPFPYYTSGIFLRTKDFNQRVMLIQTHYRNWREIFHYLPKNIPIYRHDEKLYPENPIWYKITPASDVQERGKVRLQILFAVIYATSCIPTFIFCFYAIPAITNFSTTIWNIFNAWMP